MSLVLFQPRLRPLWRLVSSRSGLARALGAGIAALALGAALVTPAFAEQPVTYTVQAGDTLVAIANQFSVPAASIASLNDLPDPNLLDIGQTLTIDLSRTSAPAPASLQSGAHYPSFTITDDGIVRRSLTTIPPAPPPPPMIEAPYYSQFDGTAWAESNCGPTTLSMALGALGVDVDQLTLRHDADEQMGFADPNDGTTWESLAYAANVSGVKIKGLYNGQSYQTWTIAGLKSQLSQGHPVVLLVRYWDLPDHVGSSFAGDHYIVGLGFDQDGNLVFNDPAVHGDGSDRVISQSDLEKAWTDTSVGMVRTAMALYK
ncbi:MAG TPA: C39 family peptidase [Chloroflexota bacterium]|nr:C39 family peptidase [Chloroflexota bacterium]